MAYDFWFYYHAAHCWIHGQSPYTCAGFLYPLPTLFLFLPFTAFPYPVARVLWWFLLLIVFVVTLKRRAFWFALYVPALQAFYLGQVDLLLLPMMAAVSGPGLAILTLKPQLVWLYLPLWFWGAPARERLRFVLVAAGLWGASLAARPRWPLEFLATTRRLSQAAYASPSLWGGGWLPVWAVVLSGLALLAISRHRWAAVTAVNPALIPYDLLVLLPRARWWLVPLSWLTQILSNAMGQAFPHVILSLAVALAGGKAGPDDGADPAAAVVNGGQALAGRPGGVDP